MPASVRAPAPVPCAGQHRMRLRPSPTDARLLPVPASLRCSGVCLRQPRPISPGRRIPSFRSAAVVADASRAGARRGCLFYEVAARAAPRRSSGGRPRLAARGRRRHAACAPAAAARRPAARRRRAARAQRAGLCRARCRLGPAARWRRAARALAVARRGRRRARREPRWRHWPRSCAALPGGRGWAPGCMQPHVCSAFEGPTSSWLGMALPRPSAAPHGRGGDHAGRCRRAARAGPMRAVPCGTSGRNDFWLAAVLAARFVLWPCTGSKNGAAPCTPDT